jgi:putative transcriptional regulator
LRNVTCNNNADNFLGTIDISGGDSITNLPGKLLVATPYSKLNDTFDKSIIYILDHSSKGAIGVIVNRLINKIPFNKIIEVLKNKEIDECMMQNDHVALSLYSGGPIERDRGLVLHTNDYKSNALFGSETTFSISSNMEVLKDLLYNKGPKKSLFVMGYTLWQEGQLEKEIESNFWNITKGYEDIIFMEDNDLKWPSVTNLFNTTNSVFAPTLGQC